MSASARPQSVNHFAHIATAPPDAILGLTEAFVADTNPNKLNLSVGVYKDAGGTTPVLRCVKEAEKRILETEVSKGYLPIDGLADYRSHVHRLVFGDDVDSDHVAVVQTPGGTGALRVAAEFAVTQIPNARIWMPNPTWANHGGVFGAAGLATESYRYLGADRTSLDFEAMIDDLNNKTSEGDLVLLHACCHNPTGVDPNADQWREIASVIQQKRLLPLIDFAYQGFGSDVEADAQGLRDVVKAAGDAIVCNSFSKNFGLYGERVGALSVVTSTAEQAGAVRSQLKKVVRGNYSNPPRHGAAIVATVLDNAELTTIWLDELREMRERIKQLRQQFVETMKNAGHDFSFLLAQNGMFSFSGLSPMQVDQLKSEHSIYIVGSGRINVAGMSEQRMDWFCDAVASVL